MHRYTLMKMLQAYTPSSEEILTKDRIISFIETHEECFERSLPIGHVTASAWLLSKDKTKALLMHHARLDKWLQPGGHCDGDPDVLRVATREAQEESGINAIVPMSSGIFDIDIHLIPANSREKEHYHYDIGFLLHVTRDEQPIGNNESKELKWFGKEHEELPPCDASVQRKFNKWLCVTYEIYRLGSI